MVSVRFCHLNEVIDSQNDTLEDRLPTCSRCGATHHPPRSTRQKHQTSRQASVRRSYLSKHRQYATTNIHHRFQATIWRQAAFEFGHSLQAPHIWTGAYCSVEDSTCKNDSECVNCSCRIEEYSPDDIKKPWFAAHRVHGGKPLAAQWGTESWRCSSHFSVVRPRF